MNIFELHRSIDLGPAWAGNTVNCVPFRGSALLSHDSGQVGAFYNDEGTVVVFRVPLEGSALERVEISSPRLPYDAHQSISMGYDPSGCLHLAFGAHNSSLLMSRSLSSDLTEGFSPPAESFPGATYPVFLNLTNRQLVMLHRHGSAHRGEICASGFDTTTQIWTPFDKPILTGIAKPWMAGPYLNMPAVDSRGRVHIFVVWRLENASTDGGAVVNSGLDYVSSTDDLLSFTTTRGVTVSRPVSQANIERVVAVPLGASLINQSSAGVLSGERPAALTYWDDGDGRPQFRLCWLDGRTWRVSTVSDFKTAFRLDGIGTLPLPHSRPDFTVLDNDDILVFYRSNENGNRLVARWLKAPDYLYADSWEQILIDEDLGFYEPVIDRTSWARHGKISAYVQRCEQGMSRDGKPDRHASPAQVVSWRLSAAARQGV